jgi:hypothetical protein
MINLVIAVFGTAVIESPISSRIKVHTLLGILQQEYVLNAICGCLLGYIVYRRRQPTAAKWLWSVGVGWFVLWAIFILHSEHTSVLFPTEHKSIWSALPVQLAPTLLAARMRFCLQALHCA